MTLMWRNTFSEILFFTGLFALLFIAMSSSSEELNMHIIAQPTFTEVQQSLNLP
jgi:hypothetical protein